MNSDLRRLFTGRAGEYLAAAHLLRLGYNCMPMAVDSGIDLIAHRLTKFGEGEMVHLQIKTTIRSTAQFAFTQAKLEQLWENSVNLVVVFWRITTSPVALVLPPSLTYMLTSGGFRAAEAPIRVVRGKARITVRLQEDGRVYMRNRWNDVSPMVGRFDRLETTETDSMAMPSYAYWSDEPRTLVEFD